MTPHIVCLCPTYKRPDLLANAVQCFLHQTWPHAELIILDDAGVHRPQNAGPWTLFTTKNRYRSLPEKFNAMAMIRRQADVYAVWEDDDIFLPSHLENIARQWLAHKSRLYVPEKVYSTYDMPYGAVRVETAHGRFHSSWAFDGASFRRDNGYPITRELNFDQQMHRKMGPPCIDEKRMSYVYRWGNGLYHGSASGDASYEDHYDSLEKMNCPERDRLIPKYDEETLLILKRLGLTPSGQ